MLLALSSWFSVGCGEPVALEVIGQVTVVDAFDKGGDDGLAIQLSLASAEKLGVDSLRLEPDTIALEQSLNEIADVDQIVLLRGALETNRILVFEILPLDRFDYIPGTTPSLPTD